MTDDTKRRGDSLDPVSEPYTGDAFRALEIEGGNVDQRERVAYLTATGEAAIEAALPYWRKTQKRTAALVRPSAVGELADQLDALGAREQIPA